MSKKDYAAPVPSKTASESKTVTEAQLSSDERANRTPLEFLERDREPMVMEGRSIPCNDSHGEYMPPCKRKVVNVGCREVVRHEYDWEAEK